MRYLFPAALTSVSVFGLLALSTADTNSYLILEADAQSVQVGDIFSVDIIANAGIPVNAVETRLQFPEDKVDVFSVDRGNSVITIWTSEPVVGSSDILFSGGTFQRGFIDTHEIATVAFRAREPGQYQIRLTDNRLMAGDGSGSEVQITSKDTSTLTMFQYSEDMSSDDFVLEAQKAHVADVNNDGSVTLQDISVFMAAWNSRQETHDLNGDGSMTFRDFSILLANVILQ